MTDPILLPLRQFSNVVEITPDLARQIVALAKIRPDKLDQEWRDPNGPMPTCITNPGDMQPSCAATDLDPAKWARASAAAGAKPVEHDSRPCGICGDPVQIKPFRLYHDCKPVPLARLEAMTAERDKALADLVSETDAKHRALTCAADYAERAESDNREIHRLANIVADDGDRIAAITAQRDELAGLLRNVVDRYENDQPIPSREIAAALAELGHPTTTAPTNGEGAAK